MRNLVIVLGDQLDRGSSAFDGFDASRDAVWMAEVRGEGEYVWSHRARIVLFLSAMRHFRERLRGSDITVRYVELDAPGNSGSLGEELKKALSELQPRKAIVTLPGEWRVREDLRRGAREAGVPLEERPDRHFLCSPGEFAEHAASRRQLRMEFFYREMRRRLGILMEDGQPAGGSWNLDAENRRSFGREGPGEIPPPASFQPDELTRQVIALVEREFPEHPGSLARFDWPVTPEQSRQAVEHFVAHQLPLFGPYQDAMWSGEPFLYHSRLSSSLNLKLVSPLEVVRAAERAWQEGCVPLASAEGFIRQIIGWREYVRGVYWLLMPEYLQRNALGAGMDLPRFYWTADTDAQCLRQVILQTLEFGYAHHIQRLMVTGLFALLYGVAPEKVHRWYLAVYVDAIEWVELPNTLGMSQYADGGVMASKPYCASGRYIHRMSNYCRSCRYDPERASGPEACPFTVLYRDFLMRNFGALQGNPRMTMQLRNTERWTREDRIQIQREADRVRAALA
ncbi:MAG: cryptochrome/photolyase family protein [Armatimonadota bacterium]